MAEPFIYPNWHILALHFPLGLLGVGVILEWISLCWPKSAIRTGGHWMLLMGALLSIPALTLGIYAFRDVVTPGGTIAIHWNEVVAQSHWTDVQWHYMTRHIWYEAIGTGLAVLAVVVYLAGSDGARRKLYWPGLVVVTIALVLMAIGGWYSGESVYRHGTAVAAATPAPPLGEADVVSPPELRPTPTDPQVGQTDAEQIDPAGQVNGTQDDEAAHREPVQHPVWVMRFLPPIQLHMLLVGGAIAFAMVAIGLSIRRWSQSAGPLPASAIPGQAVRAGQPVGAAATPPVSEEAAAERPGQPVAPAPAVLAPTTVLYPIFPARFWLTALIFGVLAALGGLWMTGDWTLRALIGPLQEEGTDWMNARVFWHIIFGVTVALCTLILAITTRFSQRAKALTLIFIILLIIAVVPQLWVGILMIYDSPQGPMTGFAQ